MTLSLGTKSAQQSQAGAGTKTWAHTPPANTVGMLLFLMQYEGANSISAYSYGGVALTTVRQRYINNVEDDGVVLAWLINSAFTGRANNNMSYTIASGNVQAISIPIIGGGGDLTLRGSNESGGVSVGLSHALNVGAALNCLGLVALGSSRNVVTDHGDLSGQTRVHDYDWGTKVYLLSKVTSPFTGSRTVGYSGASGYFSTISMGFNEGDPPVLATNSQGIILA